MGICPLCEKETNDQYLLCDDCSKEQINKALNIQPLYMIIGGVESKINLNDTKVTRMCHRCGCEYKNSAWQIRSPNTCNTCLDVVFGNIEREQEINRRIELISLINKATTLMTNNELELNLYYVKQILLDKFPMG